MGHSSDWALRVKNVVVRGCIVILLASLAAPGMCLPVSAVEVVDGTIAYHPERRGSGTSEIRLTVVNKGDVPLESMRVRLLFSRRPITDTKNGQWRERTAYFVGGQLAPGQQGEAVLTEGKAALYSQVQIVSVTPMLRIEVNGRIPELSRAPFMWEDTAFGPIGDIARELGFSVGWHEDWSLAVLTNDAHCLVLQVGTGNAVLDGRPSPLSRGVRMDRAAAIGPVAEIFRRMGAKVTYSGPDNLVRIVYPPETDAPTQ